MLEQVEGFGSLASLKTLTILVTPFGATKF